jgi:hypothetical protein
MLLMGSHRVKKFPAFYDTQKFITVSISLRTGSYFEQIESSPKTHMLFYFRYILIIFTHVRLLPETSLFA